MHDVLIAHITNSSDIDPIFQITPATLEDQLHGIQYQVIEVPSSLPEYYVRFPIKPVQSDEEYETLKSRVLSIWGCLCAFEDSAAITSPVTINSNGSILLSERVESIDKKLVSIKSGEPDMTTDPWGYVKHWCAYFDKRYAWVAIGKHIRIISRIQENISTPSRTPETFALTALPKEKSRVTVEITEMDQSGIKNAKKVEIVVATYWMNHTHHFKGMAFAPGIDGDMVEGPESIFNSFKGFNFTEPNYNEADADLLLKHIKENVCKGDEVLYQYVDAWFADILQHPDRKNGIALAIRGGSGTGKSTIFEIFERIVGDAGIEFQQMSSLTRNFNSALSEKLFCYVDDSQADDRTDLNVLKSIITSPTLVVEKKGLDQYKDNNFARFAVTSNAFDVIHLEDTDRRWLIIDMGKLYPHEIVSRDQFLWDMKEFYCYGPDYEKHLRALYWHWKKLDISNIKWRNIPETDARKAAKEYGQAAYIRFVVACACGTVDSQKSIRLADNTGEVTVPFFKDQLKDWLDRHNDDSKIPKSMKKELEAELGEFFKALPQQETGGTSTYWFDWNGIQQAYQDVNERAEE